MYLLPVFIVPSMPVATITYIVQIVDGVDGESTFARHRHIVIIVLWLTFDQLINYKIVLFCVILWCWSVC